MSTESARIAIILASKSRSDMLRRSLAFLDAQTLRPASVILSVTERADADFDIAEVLDPRIDGRVVYAPPGSCNQRNAGLDALGPDIDHVVFFDDDFFPSRYALAALARAFEAFPDVDGITGKLVADGINGPGISAAEAAEMLRQRDDAAGAADVAHPKILRDTFGLYGCNMAYRVSALGERRFDVNLPVYGWQEDVDFAAQLPGRRVEIDTFTGVHLGTKTGRETRGEMLGYSQVVNPFYLWRKGTLSAGFSLQLVARNLAANHLKALRSEPWIDRPGRLRGNWAGLWDIVSGRADPGRLSRWSTARN